MRHPRRPALAGIAMLVVLSACTTSADGPATPPTPSTAQLVVPDGRPTDIATDLAAPWEVALFRGTPLISLRNSGEIRELLTDGSTRLVGTVPDVRHSGESGLLGMAEGPDGSLYTYSTAAGGNRIERFVIDGDPGSFALGSETAVLDGLPANSYHDGGRIAFGPDGMLYASVGDAGRSGSAQDADVLGGKILRMTPEGAAPADNPFDGSLVYSLGHRNVQGLGWSDDGTMFAAEFGQDAWDELNIIRPGANYGWPDVEGRGGGDRFVDPVQVWTTDSASPSGITVIDDTIFVANLRGEVLRAVPVNEPSSAREYFAGDYGRLRSVLAGPDDTLWIVTNNTDGRGTPRAADDRILGVALAPASSK